MWGIMVGKFCRSGINCRGSRTVPDKENLYSIGFFAMARRLLISAFQG
jgi:hypothetical protein